MRNRAVDGETLTQNAESGTLLTALVHAVNTLFNGCIPEELQSSLLISLYKKNDPIDMDNYRGISLMPVLLKITCSVIAVRLSNGFEARDMLTDAQAGFRPYKRCVGQVAALCETISRWRGKYSSPVVPKSSPVKKTSSSRASKKRARRQNTKRAKRQNKADASSADEERNFVVEDGPVSVEEDSENEEEYLMERSPQTADEVLPSTSSHPRLCTSASWTSRRRTTAYPTRPFSRSCATME